MKFLVLISAAFCLWSASAYAQAIDTATAERMDRLERDLMLIQKQIARGEPVHPPLTDADIPEGGAAQLEVRLSAIEEELRSLHGKLEENEFQVRKLSENFDKLQRDVEYRFGEQGKPSATNGAIGPVEETPEKKDDAPEARKPLVGETTAGDGVLRGPDSHPGEDGKTFATPREHYNYAFRLLNQTKYEEAAKAFDAFTKEYPKDPLVGNAYYWQGETYYIRGDYVSAADSFRQGFEAVPGGPKAADNLLKLAMSLDALNRTKEACVVLTQITTKFKKSSVNITQKADQERKRIGCK